MDNTYLWIAGFVYLVMCIWVAIEGDIRGHDWFYVFMFCIFCSPLLGAIMFSQYKPEYEEEAPEE